MAKLITRPTADEFHAFLTAQAMEDSGISVFQILPPQKDTGVYTVYGKYERETIAIHKLDDLINSYCSTPKLTDV